MEPNDDQSEYAEARRRAGGKRDKPTDNMRRKTRNQFVAGVVGVAQESTLPEVLVLEHDGLAKPVRSHTGREKPRCMAKPGKEQYLSFKDTGISHPAYRARVNRRELSRYLVAG